MSAPRNAPRGTSHDDPILVANLLCMGTGIDGTLPRAYGLPKIHKQDCPLRIIVSSVDSPLYAFSVFLHNIIKLSIPKPESHILNSFDLVNKLNGLHIQETHDLISLDVVSLFTNIPLNLAEESIANRWTYISDNCSIPRDEFLRAIRMVLKSTYFSFNFIIYQQTFGTPMGSPLSPIIADITMQDLECKAMETLRFRPLFYIRYVDDIAMSVPSAMKSSTVKIFNSFHPRLQFTMEEGTDRKLNFLDTTINIRDNHIEFDWYQKPTHSGRYLNFDSAHPLYHKKGTIICLIDHALLLSHPRYHQKNLEHVINTLLQNNYPLPLIFNTLNRRLKTFLKNQNAIHIDNNTVNTATKKFFNIPFIPRFSHQFKQVLQDLNTSLSFTSMNKLSCVIKAYKDPLPKIAKKNVVYKISCKDCDASYVGQTGRLLNTRTKEHRNHINRNTQQQSNYQLYKSHSLLGKHQFKDKISLTIDDSRVNSGIKLSLIIYNQKFIVNYVKCMDIKNVQKWCREFKNGRTDVHDEQRAGRPSNSDEMIAKVEKIMLEDRRVTIRELCELIPDVSVTTV
ncbi:PREDICTED: uncharacterized protein LOC105556380 [Vollenhovia emeryi]|uniref:uncharacterized protein LOC105556380 n=1 Tax=Vollenhovia emeryi TaxID=411798 RepID=UPI0005F524FC|nr:PREDICTED: uncharacterized protein LOC105556380 [Vollenhovia emeryi]